MDPERTTDGTSIHPTAIVEDGVSIGEGTRIWHQSHVRSGCRIGSGCTIGFSVYVDSGVVIGDRCKIQNHVSLYRGVTLEDEVFIGPAVAFTNDRYPRATSTDWSVVATTIRRGASIGAGAVIVCGVDVGAWSMVGAGAVVTRDVPAHGLVIGSPARLGGWVCRCGHPLARLGESPPDRCAHCRRPTLEMVPS
jgi:acetyltransferase-like isoleucine patch superfamily enzyme